METRRETKSGCSLGSKEREEEWVSSDKYEEVKGVVQATKKKKKVETWEIKKPETKKKEGQKKNINK